MCYADSPRLYCIIQGIRVEPGEGSVLLDWEETGGGWSSFYTLTAHPVESNNRRLGLSHKNNIFNNKEPFPTLTDSLTHSLTHSPLPPSPQPTKMKDRGERGDSRSRDRVPYATLITTHLPLPPQSPTYPFLPQPAKIKKMKEKEPTLDL